MNDNQFATTMMVIIGTLIALTVLIIVIANLLIPKANYSEDNLVQSNIQERIEPIGSVAIAGVETTSTVDGNDTNVEAILASADAGDTKSAEELYTACAACHNAGVLNAPKLGDKAGWDTRIGKGKEALYASAINGIGTMPAKGGRADYSDDDIKKVVDYMLESVK